MPDDEFIDFVNRVHSAIVERDGFLYVESPRPLEIGEIIDPEYGRTPLRVLGKATRAQFCAQMEWLMATLAPGCPEKLKPVHRLFYKTEAAD